MISCFTVDVKQVSQVKINIVILFCWLYIYCPFARLPSDVYGKRKAPEREAHSNDSGSQLAL